MLSILAGKVLVVGGEISPSGRDDNEGVSLSKEGVSLSFRLSVISTEGRNLEGRNLIPAMKKPIKDGPACLALITSLTVLSIAPVIAQTI